MNDLILSLRGLRKSYGASEIIRGVELELRAGERHALIGPNGAGKSKLFHGISGNTEPSAGEIVFDGQRIARAGLARSFQITNIFPRLTVFENIRLAVLRQHRLQYACWRVLDRVAAVREDTERLLERVRLQVHAAALAGEMTYSAQRSLELGMTLARDPQVVLLDEPMAGMSTEETEYTSSLIRETTAGRALLLVEHDMSVVFDLGERVSVLVYGELIATGTPDEMRGHAGVREAYLGEEVAA